MANVSFRLARWIVVVLLCLAAATSAFAQGGTGTLTGTVVDGTGAAIPGATVNVTELNTGTERTVVTDDTGVFRFAALNPGRLRHQGGARQLQNPERRRYQPACRRKSATSANWLCRSAASPRPSRSPRRSRRSRSRTARGASTLTVDDIANIQTKGRDIFGMLGTLPGVQDTNLNRDFTQWRSAISITINGMPSQNKDVRVDGINIVDEGGCGTAYVNLNMDAVGEVQVISNGYTAENGRNNGGVISMVTKSGTNQLQASGWYNGRRDKFNENDYFRKATNQAEAALSGQHLRLQRRRPGRDPGPGRQPEGKGGSKKFYFFVSQEFIDDARPTTTTRANMPTALEYNGDFSQTRVTAEPFSRSSTRLTGQPFPGQHHPG